MFCEDLDALTSRYEIYCTSARWYKKGIARRLKDSKGRYSHDARCEGYAAHHLTQDPFACFIGWHGTPIFLRRITTRYLAWWFGNVAPCAALDGFDWESHISAAGQIRDPRVRRGIIARAYLARTVRSLLPDLYMVIPHVNVSLAVSRALRAHMCSVLSGTSTCHPWHLCTHLRHGVLDRHLSSRHVRFARTRPPHATSNAALPPLLLQHARIFVRLYRKLLAQHPPRFKECALTLYASNHAHSFNTADVHKQDYYIMGENDTFIESYIAAHFAFIMRAKRVTLYN
ncbi:ORF57 [Ranid herpesvirus 1]|uniref:ORF57 n=1 Tax=Ranid herpesvirus 1 TaxID=85655 RepID=Q14VQ1_9VIRU|nr:ORF57 [Ranid herpesvirus 1]ABG25771.1 ORF57 [Ranid herpesvirus 1]